MPCTYVDLTLPEYTVIKNTNAVQKGAPYVITKDRIIPNRDSLGLQIYDLATNGFVSELSDFTKQSKRVKQTPDRKSNQLSSLNKNSDQSSSSCDNRLPEKIKNYAPIKKNSHVSQNMKIPTTARRQALLVMQSENDGEEWVIVNNVERQNHPDANVSHSSTSTN